MGDIEMRSALNDYMPAIHVLRTRWKLLFGVPLIAALAFGLARITILPPPALAFDMINVPGITGTQFMIFQKSAETRANALAQQSSPSRNLLPFELDTIPAFNPELPNASYNFVTLTTSVPKNITPDSPQYLATRDTVIETLVDVIVRTDLESLRYSYVQQWHLLRSEHSKIALEFARFTILLSSLETRNKTGNTAPNSSKGSIEYKWEPDPAKQKLFEGDAINQTMFPAIAGRMPIQQLHFLSVADQKQVIASALQDLNSQKTVVESAIQETQLIMEQISKALAVASPVPDRASELASLVEKQSGAILLFGRTLQARIQVLKETKAELRVLSGPKPNQRHWALATVGVFFAAFILTASALIIISTVNIGFRKYT